MSQRPSASYTTGRGRKEIHRMTRSQSARARTRNRWIERGRVRVYLRREINFPSDLTSMPGTQLVQTGTSFTHAPNSIKHENLFNAHILELHLEPSHGDSRITVISFLLGAFVKLRKAAISFVMFLRLSFGLSVRIEQISFLSTVIH
jgi:hypothetical protein